MDVFEEKSETSQSYFEALVGETGKYKTPEELAKGYANAEARLNDLKAENARREIEFRELKAKLEVLEKVAMRLTDGEKETATTVIEQNTFSVSKEPDLEGKIRSTVEELKEKERRDNNLAQVNKKLFELYGDKATEVIKLKAAELGVGVSWLQDAAARSPQAFYVTLGIPQSTANNSQAGAAAPLKTDVNTQALSQNVSAQTGQAKEGTYSYYAELRKANPALYYSAKVQAKMFEDAKAKGEAFYQ